MGVTAVKEETTMTEEEAIKIANELERVEKVRSDLREKLRGYVEENGPVDTGERIWSVSKSVTWRVDPDKIESLSDYIYLSGQNHWDYLSITPGNIKKLGFSNEVLSKFCNKNESSRFSSRKSPEK